MTTISRIHRDHSIVRFTAEQIADILQRRINGEPSYRIAHQYRVTRKQINDVVCKHGRCSILRRKRGGNIAETPAPSEDEIRERCELIQSRWDDAESARRAGALGPLGVEELEPVSIGD